MFHEPRCYIPVSSQKRDGQFPKTEQGVGAPFGSTGSQQLRDEQLTAETDFMARGVRKGLVSTKQILL
jgi:hypothetical protein